MYLSSSSFSLVSHFFHVCFSVMPKSHPLYFSYFIFFFPHLLSLISFLSPLFITTALLLLLSLLPLSPNPEFPPSKFGFLLSVFQILTEIFSSKDDKMDEGIVFLDEFQAYLDVFQAPLFESLEENCPESQGSEGRDHVGPMEKEPIGEEEEEEDDDEVPIAEEKSHERNTKLEDMFCQKEDKEVKAVDTQPNKAEESEEKMALRNSGSKVVSGNNNNTKIDDDAKESTTNSDGEYFGTPERSWEVKPFCSSIGSYGSMRKEKEWRRTLACKLYEERHSVGGSEGMDLLWETYDDTEPNINTKVQEKGNTSGEDNDNDDDDEEEEKGVNSKYCCLLALKFSAGKMNLGMRRPNLVKISKALKGIKLLHYVSKHDRKGYQ